MVSLVLLHYLDSVALLQDGVGYLALQDNAQVVDFANQFTARALP